MFQEEYPILRENVLQVMFGRYSQIYVQQKLNGYRESDGLVLKNDDCCTFADSNIHIKTRRHL